MAVLPQPSAPAPRRYFLTPAAGVAPRKHLARSITRPVTTSELEPYLTTTQRALIGDRATLRVWGMGANSEDRFARIKSGDVLLFYTPENGTRGFNYASEVLTTFDDGAAVSAYLWPGEERFPFILILGPPIQRFLSLDAFNEIGSEPYETIPNSFLLQDSARSRALDEFYFSSHPGALATFSLRPGDKIKRVALHDAFGGSRQGGISPSLKSPNVFLFTDPQTGEQHGYVDGWKTDGRFHYTGEGQRGDQEFKSGNAAVLNHKKQGRTLRLFQGSGGVVTYDGTFEIDDEQPFYFTDAPETNDGPTRSVIVFRLRSLDAIPPPKVASGNSPSSNLVVRNVPVEQNNTERFFVNPQSEPTEADRREAKLVRDFCDFIKRKRGYVLARKQIIPPGEAKPLFTDVFIEELNLLIEAKGSTERGAFRMALGQILDYRRFLGEPRCAILLPAQPREDLLKLASVEAIDVFWAAAGGFEGTSALW